MVPAYSVEYASFEAEDEEAAADAANQVGKATGREVADLCTDEAFWDLANSFDEVTPDYTVPPAKSECSDCGRQVDKILGCPDGAEVCPDCEHKH